MPEIDEMVKYGRRARSLGSARRMQPRYKLAATVAPHPNSSSKGDGLNTVREHSVNPHLSRRGYPVHRHKSDPQQKLPFTLESEPSPNKALSGNGMEATSTPTRSTHRNSTGAKNLRMDVNLQDYGIGAGGGMQVKMMREEQRAEQSKVMERELSTKVGSLLVKGRVQRKAHELMASHSEVAGDVMDEHAHQLQDKNKPFAIPSLHRSILEKDPDGRTESDIKTLKKRLEPLMNGNLFLKGLPHGLRNQLLYYLRYLSVPPSECLYLQNQPGHHFFVMVVGEVRLSKQSKHEMDSYLARRIDPRASLTVQGKVRNGTGLYTNFNDTESEQPKADGNPSRFSDLEDTGLPSAAHDAIDDFMHDDSNGKQPNHMDLALAKVSKQSAEWAEGVPVVNRAALHGGGLHLQRSVNGHAVESSGNKTRAFMGEELRDKALRMERVAYTRHGNPEIIDILGGNKTFDSFGEQVLYCDRMPVIRDHTATTTRSSIILCLSRADFDQASYEFNVCTYGKKRTAIPALKGLESQKREAEVDKLAHIAQWDVFQKDVALVVDRNPEHLHFVVRGFFQLCNLRPDLRTPQVFKELHAVGFGKKYREGIHYEVLCTGSEGDFFGTQSVFGDMAIRNCVVNCCSPLEVMKFNAAAFVENIKGTKVETSLFMAMAKRIQEVQHASIWGINPIRFPEGLSADEYLNQLEENGVVAYLDDEEQPLLDRLRGVVKAVMGAIKGEENSSKENVMNLLSQVSRGQQVSKPSNHATINHGRRSLQ